MSSGGATWADTVRTALDRIDDAGQRREIRTVPSLPSFVDHHGNAMVSFASNDYLGLATHPQVIEAAHAALDRFGAGAGASRLVVGSRPIHDELETELAAWRGTEAALLFPTGFAANIGVLASLAKAAGQSDTLICSDELNHASIIDGARLSRARVGIYPHNDMAALAELLDRRTERHAVIVSDTVFSMDCDEAPIDALVALAAKHGAALVVDEAHSVLGPSVPASLGDGPEVIRVGTLSKTLGSLGGFVCGRKDVIDLLVNTARSFIFTTATTPADAAAAFAALDIVRSPQGALLVDRLRTHVDTVRAGHPSPIIPVLVGGEHAAMELSAALRERGLLVPAIRPPTVAAGTSRLRVALSASHRPDDVARLRAALDELVPDWGEPLDD